MTKDKIEVSSYVIFASVVKTKFYPYLVLNMFTSSETEHSFLFGDLTRIYFAYWKTKFRGYNSKFTERLHLSKRKDALSVIQHMKTFLKTYGNLCSTEKSVTKSTMVEREFPPHKQTAYSSINAMKLKVLWWLILVLEIKKNRHLIATNCHSYPKNSAPLRNFGSDFRKES